MRFVFFAAHERSEDADEGYGSADDKGDMESMRESLLQKIDLRGRQGMPVSLQGKYAACRCATEPGEDGACQGYTQTLPDDAAGGEEAGCAALPRTGRSTQ